VCGARTEACTTARPPTNTRAAAGGEVIPQLIQSNSKRYAIDWDSVYLDRERFLDLRNSFQSCEKEAAKFTKGL